MDDKDVKIAKLERMVANAQCQLNWHKEVQEYFNYQNDMLRAKVKMYEDKYGKKDGITFEFGYMLGSGGYKSD